MRSRMLFFVTNMKVRKSNPKAICTASKTVFILRTWSLIRTFLAFWVLIHISGSLFSFFWFHSRKECQLSLHVYIFAGIGSGLHYWQILIFTYAYALIFIHRRFGSLFWLLGVLIGSLFQSLGVLFSFGGSENGFEIARTFHLRIKA